MVAVVETICSEKKQMFTKCCISSRTLTRRIEEVSKDVKLRQINQLNSLEYLSICLDESTDTAQLGILIRGVFTNFDIFENYLGLVSMQITTTGEDILKELLQCTYSVGVDLKKIVSVTTDGAPAMIDKNKGFNTFLKNHIMTLGHTGNLIKLHSKIHHEALFARTTNLQVS